MPAVAPQLPPSQQSAFGFYSSEKTKKKLSVPMKKKNKKGKGAVNLSKAVQSMSITNASALVLQAKTPILAKPDLSKQVKSGKAVKPKRNKKIKKNHSNLTNSSIQESGHKEKGIEDLKIKNVGSDSGVEKQVDPASHNVKEIMGTFETYLTDFISGFKNGKVSAGKKSDKALCSLSEKKVSKKGKAPPVPVATEKRITTKKLGNGDITPSKEGVKTKVLKKAKKSNKVSLAKLLQEMDYSGDTKKCGLAVLAYLLAPHDPKEFFESYWESKPLLIQRRASDYFDGLFSTEVFDSILREQYVEYTKNLDVTCYSDGIRQTHNPSGRVYPSVVWDYFSNGCSLRMLNPQTFHEPVWLVLGALQEYMGSFCGANMYLTPAGTQGFAPHWDDIEAFILQLEGKKRWRVYKPRDAGEVLPRFSSPNLTQEEIGSPIIDVLLNPGDVLYFPRGFIHQAEAVEETHSLHITISMYQKNAWVDLLEKVFSAPALNEMAAKNVSIRKGLPLGCLDYMGSTAASAAKKGKNSEIKEQRKKFRQQVSSLVSEMLTDQVVDRAMDEMGRQFVRVALPPCLSEDDLERTVELDGERWEAGKVRGRVEVDPETRIKLLGAMTLRCVRDARDASSEYRVYHSVENSREYEGRAEQFVTVDARHLPAVQRLVLAYPEYTAVEDLPLPTLEDKLTVAMSLWEQHLVMTEYPLIGVDEDSVCSGADSEF